MVLTIDFFDADVVETHLTPAGYQFERVEDYTPTAYVDVVAGDQGALREALDRDPMGTSDSLEVVARLVERSEASRTVFR